MDNYRISPVTGDDMDAIISLANRVLERHVIPTLSDEGQQAIRRSVEENTRQILDPDIYQARKVEIGREIVAYAAWRHGFYIAQLYVDSDYQGRGIGRALLDNIKAMASGPELELRASLNSVPFYRKNGFRPTGDEAEINGIRFLHMSHKI